MKVPTNRFKHALAAGQRQIGVWASLASTLSVEAMAPLGFDWVVIDTEHAPNELTDVLGQLRSAEPGTATPMVRVPWNDFVTIKRVLDLGAQTLLIPFIQSQDEAKQAIAATRYPPRGIRGVAYGQRASRFGQIDNYFGTAEAEICVILQLETRAGLERLEEVAAIDGVDGLFIGPSDLAGDLGHLGNPGHPEVQGALKDAAARCRVAGKPAGTIAPAEADAERYLDGGYTFVAVGSDVGFMLCQAQATLRRFKPAASA